MAGIKWGKSGKQSGGCVKCCDEIGRVM